MQEMIIPAGKAGLIIGKGGETIKQLQVTMQHSVIQMVMIIYLTRKRWLAALLLQECRDQWLHKPVTQTNVHIKCTSI